MDDLPGLVGWMATVVGVMGWPGVAVLVALENVFPPIPSEVVLPFAGFVARQGEGHVLLLLVAATAGSTLGAALLYESASAIGMTRVRTLLCRLPLVTEGHVDRADDWFYRHGRAAVFWGRFVPVVRSLVSLPAGAACMPRGVFFGLTVLGSAIWNAVWIGFGYLLGSRWQESSRFAEWLDVALLVVGVAVMGRLLYRALAIQRERARVRDCACLQDGHS